MSVVVQRTVTKDLISNSTTVKMVKPYTAWMPAIAIKYLKVLMQLIERSGNFKCAIAIQTATTDPDSPDAWIVKGNYVSTTGRDCQGLFDVSADVDGKFWFRLGVAALNTTGSALETGNVAITPTFRT